MGLPRAYWSPAALEVREAQDALLCVEAVHSSAVSETIAAINQDGRHDCLPQIQDAPAGWGISRTVRPRGLSEAAGGVRLFKAAVQYSLGPGTGAACSIQQDADAPEPETSLVYAFSAPTHMLEEALSARRGPRGAKGFFKRKSDVPTMAALSNSDGDKPSWGQAANDLHREIANDLLTHTCNAIFDEGPDAARGPPAIKSALQNSSGIVLTGHGAGALVAYQATISLLRHYPEALKAKLKCITFGMPVMGWDGREQRNSFLRLIAPTLTSIPLLRRDLPCPHFLHIVRQEDLVPRSSLCSRKVRSSVAVALGITANRRSALDSHTSWHDPYSNHFAEELMSLEGGGHTTADGLEAHRSASAGADYDSDDSDSASPASGAHAGANARGEGTGGESEDEAEGQGDVLRGVGRWGGWKRWKKNALVGVHESSVDWDLVSKAVRDDMAFVSLPEWWPLGKFWFFCDSEDFDAEVSLSSTRSPPRVNGAAAPSTSTSVLAHNAGHSGSSPCTRRDGTVVRVRRWVVQFPYLRQVTSGVKRDLFDPFPDSVGLLRDMFSTGLHSQEGPTSAQRNRDKQDRCAADVRRRHWPVEHHVGQYINALHSWVGSSEWQISRRREIRDGVSVITSASKTGAKGGGSDKGAAVGTGATPLHSKSHAPSMSPILEVSSPETLPAVTPLRTPSMDSPACQPRVDAAQCSCVNDGVQTLLEVTLRGVGLHFVDALELQLFSWSGPAAGSGRGGRSDNGVGGNCFLSSGPASYLQGGHAADGFASNGAGGGSEQDESSMKIRMRLATTRNSSSVLVASCEAPYGWLGVGAEARLMGPCMREIRVACDVSRVTSFRALHGPAAALENAPVCAVLEQALLLQEIIGHADAHADGGEAAHPAHSRPQDPGEEPAGTRQGANRASLRHRQARQVLLGDLTGSPSLLPEVDITKPAGVELVEELIAELMNLEDKTRSQWTDFMRTLSLGGLDPHADSSYASKPSPGALVHESLEEGPSAALDGAGEVALTGLGSSSNEDSELLNGRSSIKAHVRALLRARERKLACLDKIEELISRPLSLSMDRSPRFKQMMGLTMAITAGATIMAGSCLLAPAAAASMLPSMAAYVTPAHAVTGMFATSIVGTHMQARCTIDGSYVDKLLHFAAALRIYTPNIFPRAVYLEAAIATRVLKHASSVLFLAPMCSLEQLLASPALFVSHLAHPDSWRRLIDSQHYFEFLDFKDKKFVLDFLWVIVTIHRVRVQLTSTVSVALVASHVGSPMLRSLQEQLFPTACVSRAQHGVDGEAAAAEEGSEKGWEVQSYKLTEANGLLRVDTVNVPESYLSTARTPTPAGKEQHEEDAEPATPEKIADAARSKRAPRRTCSRGRAELVRGLASAEILVLAWHEASQAGSVLIIGRLLARRACSALVPSPVPFMPGDAVLDSGAALQGMDRGEERVFSFKVLLTGVPLGDGGAVRWLADKINRKLDVSRWRTFIAVARRRIRMQRPQSVDVAFLHSVGQDALQELDLQASEVPDVADLKLLLASRALDDDWLTRPALQLDVDDLLVLNHRKDMQEVSELADADHLPSNDAGGGAAAWCDAGKSNDDKPALAPGFSVLRDVTAEAAAVGGVTQGNEHAQGSGKGGEGPSAEAHRPVPSGNLNMRAVRQVSRWLLVRLQSVYAPGGRAGAGAHVMCEAVSSPWMKVCCALRPHMLERQVVVLQAAVRRTLQRAMLVCEEFDAGSFAWRYSRCALSEPALPANSYWPLMGQHQAPPATPKPSEHLGAYGHSSCQRIIPLVRLLQSRGRFRDAMVRVLQVYWIHIARLRMLDRYFDELSAVAGKLVVARSGKRHPMTVLQQLFGFTKTNALSGHDVDTPSLSPLVPKELLTNDGEEGCGVSYLLFQQLGAAPLPGNTLPECYEVHLGPMYVSLAQDLCRLPLYSNDSMTGLIEELVACGASCSPPLAVVLASIGTQAARLEDVLYASVPPALQLRVSLNVLLDACPATHPDAQHLRSAMQHIDSSFAIASLVNTDSPTLEVQCPTILGRLGGFFWELESRFDKTKRNVISRGPVVQAHLELLGDAVDKIQAFRTRLSLELAQTSALYSAPAGSMCDEHAAAGDDDGWQFVSRGLDFGSSGHMLTVERAVNAVLLTRLWPTLEDLLSGVERDQDARITLGLPAFGWDHKGLAKLLDHLGIPACLFPSSRAAPLEEADSERKPGGMPIFYAGAAERLRDMARAKTPEDKALALAAAARSILVCFDKHLTSMYEATSNSGAQDGSSCLKPEILGEGSKTTVVTLLQRCLAFTVLRMAHENRASSFRRDVLYVRCLHVPALSVGILQSTGQNGFVRLASLQGDSCRGQIDDAIQNLLQADVGLLMSEFEEALEWIDAEVRRMLRPKRSSACGLDDAESEIDADKDTAYGALVEAAGSADWDEVLRLLEQRADPGDADHDDTLRPWQRVLLPSLDTPIVDSSECLGKARSALHAAASGGHGAMLLFLMYKTAMGMRLDAKPGDQAFCSTVYGAVKMVPAGHARARADYAFRALVMLRGQRTYATRLEQLCQAVGTKEAWMDEEEEGLFSACFGDLQVNAELARAVATELDSWISKCVAERRVLGGLSASNALLNAIVFAIKSVQHQFDRVDKQARPRLSKPSLLSTRWRSFVQQVERSMSENEGLAGQRLSDLLSWPLQRSMRYKDLLFDLIHGAACCAEGGRDATIDGSGVSPRQLLEAIARDTDRVATSALPPALMSAASNQEVTGRALALQMARCIKEAEVSVCSDGVGEAGAGMGAELVGAIGALMRVKDETMLLNRKVAEASQRQEAADKASFYLEGMVGAEQVVSQHCEFVAHCVATCKLPEGPGTWSQGKTLKLLLLRGTRRQLLFYNQALGVSGTTRTCVLKVDMSSVISISEAQADKAQQEVTHAPGGAAGAAQSPALTETFTMTLKLGSSSQSSDTYANGECEGGGHGGKLVTSVLTLTSVPSSSSGWLGSISGNSNANLERLRDLVQWLRVLMREENSKRQSLQRHRISFRDAHVP